MVDGTALPEKGTASVGVALQDATVPGKNAKGQTLVSRTLGAPPQMRWAGPPGEVDECSARAAWRRS